MKYLLIDVLINAAAACFFGKMAWWDGDWFWKPLATIVTVLFLLTAFAYVYASLWLHRFV